MRVSRFPTIRILVASVEGWVSQVYIQRGGGYPPWQVLCSVPTSPLDTFTPSVILIPSTYPPPLPLGYSRHLLDILIPSPSGYSPIHHGHTHSPPLGYPSLLVTPGGHHWRQYSPPLPNRMTDTCENITFLQLRWLAVITL